MRADSEMKAKVEKRGDKWNFIGSGLMHSNVQQKTTARVILQTSSKSCPFAMCSLFSFEERHVGSIDFERQLIAVVDSEYRVMRSVVKPFVLMLSQDGVTEGGHRKVLALLYF